MFDFRYHALSLVAVLVTLVLGLLLGIAIGDEGLVSSAENRLRENLKEDVSEARADAQRARSEVDRLRRYEELTYAPLVAERLDGRRIVVLFLDERNEAIFDHVRDAIAPSGGRLRFVSTLRGPLDLEALAGAAAGTQYERIAEDPSLLDDLGRRVGTQFVQGGRLLRELREELLVGDAGELEPSEAVVVVRTPGERLDREDRRRMDAFVEGLLEGLQSFGTPVVGVEEVSTDPSQVTWYRDHGLASVDNVDEVPGRASLVFALAGAADGAYGVKRTRDALIPDAISRAP